MTEEVELKKPVRVFISYAREDDDLRRELRFHLAVLEQLSLVEVWDDERLVAGSDWAQEIDNRLDQSNVILLLVSQHYLASDFCYRNEMPQALKQRELGAAAVIPIFIRDCEYTGTPLAHLTGVPREGTVVSCPDRNKAWKEVVLAIRNVVERLWNHPEPSNKEHHRYEGYYRQGIKSAFGRLHMLGVREMRDIKQDFSIAYVSLRVRSSTGDGNAVLPAEQLLFSEPLLALRGAAGSGKSTLMHWACFQCSRTDDPNNSWQDLIPFYVPLRRLTDEDAGRPNINAFIDYTLDPKIFGEAPPSGWVQNVLRNRRGVILLDGVDELPAPARPAFWRWLDEFNDFYPGNRIYITSRYFPERRIILNRDNNFERTVVLWDLPSAFLSADLEVMDDRDVRLFIRNWHEAVITTESDVTQQAELEEARDRLPERLAEPANRRVRELIRTPLLCALVCALHWRESGYLPRRRVDLYDRCCVMLIEERDVKRSISRPEGPVGYLTLQDKEMLLQRLALDMMRNKLSETARGHQIEISREEAENWIAPNITMCERDEARQSRPQEVIDHLIERSGLLREPTIGRIDFPHRTFQEYLAACAAGALNQIGDLVDRALDDQWHETIILAAGTKVGGVPFGNALVEKLLDRAEHPIMPPQAERILNRAKDTSRPEQAQADVVRFPLPEQADVRAQPKEASSDRHKPPIMALQLRSQSPRFKKSEFTDEGELADSLHDIFFDTNDSIWKGLDAIRRKSKGIFDYVTNSYVSEMPEEKQNLDVYAKSSYRSTLLVLAMACLETAQQIRPELKEKVLNHLKEIVPPRTRQEADHLAAAGDAALPLLLYKECKDYETEIVTACARTVALISTPAAIAMLEEPYSYGDDLRDEVVAELCACRELHPLRLPRMQAVVQSREQWDLKPLRPLIEHVTDVGPLASIEPLKELYLNGWTDLTDLSKLVHHVNIKRLTIRGSRSLADLKPLSSLRHLEELCLMGLIDVSNITPLGALIELWRLSLAGCKSITDIKPIQSLSALRILDLTGCPQVSSLEPLSGMTNLNRLSLNGCSGVTGLSPLASLESLETLDLRGCSALVDISPISQLPHLHCVDLRGCNVIADLECLSQAPRLKYCAVDWYLRDRIPEILRIHISRNQGAIQQPTRRLLTA